MGWTLSFRKAMRVAFISFFFLISLPHLRAQDESTAKKSADISAFGGSLIWEPDLYPQRDLGATVGVDFTKYIRHWPVAPSFEARVSRASGPVINESSYLIGLKVQRDLGRFHPYADLLWGRGTIHYNQHTFYPGDNTATIDFGAGLDFDLNKRWSAKIDWQHQHWEPGSNQIFHPSGVLFGVTYHIPFKRFNESHSLR